MKIWEKIYLVVIALFLLVLNLCNVLVFRSSYQKSVDSVEKTAVSYWNHIAISMAEDLAEMEGDDTTEWQLFQTYVSSYSTRNCAFELWKKMELRERSETGTQVTYSASEGKLSSAFLKETGQQKEILDDGGSTGQVTILKMGDEKYTCTSGSLTGTEYQLVIYEKVTDILMIWENQMLTFVWMEVAASLLMAILLYFIIKKFLEPISRLSAMTAGIASGDYDSRLEVKGEDELSALARDINYMAGQVQGHIQNKEAQARQKQEFIDALSHELRTPLTSVRGYAQLVQNTAVSREKQMEYMDYIVKESGRMVDMTETLRQVILLQQGEMKKEKISLKMLKEQLWEIVRLELTDKRINWCFQAGEGALEGNRVLVELFFLNLIRNSFHACEEGGEISILFDTDCAVISDDGRGMSEECREHIFEPFYREDKSRSRKMGGMGLGMYLCWNIARKHQWQIRIQSEKGVGTEIKVFFNNSFTSRL